MSPSTGRFGREHLEVALDLIGRAGGVRDVEVTGSSMVPTIRPGGALRVDLSARRPRFGDITLFRHGDGGMVVHRCLGRRRTRRHGTHRVMRGDGRPTFDPPVRDGDVLGVVRAIRRDGSWWSLDGAGARAWAMAIAAHDLVWGVGIAALSRGTGGGPGSRPARFLAALDGRTLRAADRLLFRCLHRPAPERTSPAAGAGENGIGPLL